MSFYEWAQERLTERGFDVGGIDGIWGRKSTAALRRFQSVYGHAVTGRLDEPTVRALRAANVSLNVDVKSPPKADLYETYPWMALARTKMGLHEVDDNIELRKFLKSDGKTLGDPAKLPWCGDFVETIIAVSLPAEALPVNPYLARNWLKFGKECEPMFGAVLVFWRGAKNGTSGHVGNYVGEDATHFYVLGGNQSNKISIARLDKKRLLGARFPLTFTGPSSTKVFMTANGIPVTTNEA